MLIVSKERYIPVTVNTLVLSREDYFFYIHRDVYDQTVILADQYDLDTLKDLVGGARTNDDAVYWFYEQAPNPLHILAPYLALIDGEIEQDMETCCGILHVVTSMIHVRNFVLKPVEVRKSVSFSLSIKDEYAMAWDRFFLSAIPYDQSRDHVAALLNRLYRLPLGEEAARETGAAGAIHTNKSVSPDIAATSRLEGIYLAKEEPMKRPSLASTEAERRATKELLSE